MKDAESADDYLNSEIEKIKRNFGIDNYDLLDILLRAAVNCHAHIISERYIKNVTIPKSSP